MYLFRFFQIFVSQGSKILCVMLLLVLVHVIFPSPSKAVPAFARKYDISCTSCHTKPRN